MGWMAKKREKLSDQVRRAVDSSGMSRYAICKALGLAQATMSRFMSGQGGLSMESLDELADLLDLNISTGGTGRTKKGPSGGEH
jgi:transcriptional regulator with XRE-family HTH domain